MNLRSLMVGLAGLSLLVGCSGPSTVNVVGQADIELSTTSLSFGSIPLGMTSPTQTLVLTNIGTASGAVGTILIGGTLPLPSPQPFLLTNGCPAVLLKGASCSVTVAFAPTVAGTVNEVLTVPVGKPYVPSVSLSGTGTASGPVVSLSSTALTFAMLPVGQAATQTVTLSNIGVATLQIGGFTLTGANVSSFALSGSCQTSSMVAAGASCFLTVTYAPTVAGPVSAQVNVADNAVNAPQTISLASK